MFQTIHNTWEEVVSMRKLFKCVCVRASAAWWGRWMMDARQESYATAPSALMASGRYTPAPNADLVAEDDTAILHSHFFALSIPIFSPSLTMGTAGSIAPYPRWLCVVLNKAFCSRRAHCIESCTSYRWGTDRLLSGWSWGFKHCAHIQRDEKRTAGGPRKRGCHVNTPTWDYRSELSLASVWDSPVSDSRSISICPQLSISLYMATFSSVHTVSLINLLGFF